MKSSSPIRLGLAGSTAYTAQLADGLVQDNRFDCRWVLTSAPKPVGRTKTVAANPLHQWAEIRSLPTILVTNKIDQKVQQSLNSDTTSIDVLLVVDFGYLIPQWLLELPIVAPLNLHPSRLPEWRGSSPGQAVILSGAPTSAISLIKMDNQLDHGPILFQQSFKVQLDWTQTDYYQSAFASIQPKLPDLIDQLCQKQLSARSQPDQSPTPIARELSREDGLIPWGTVSQVIRSERAGQQKLDQLVDQLPPFLTMIWNYLIKTGQTSVSLENFIHFVARATRALQPWPGLWTLAPTTKGERRLKLLSATVSDSGLLELGQVQLEGQQPALWNQIKNVIAH